MARALSLLCVPASGYLMTTPFPGADGDYKSRCEAGNSLADGYIYKYNDGRGTSSAVCGEDAEAWCCRCKAEGSCEAPPKATSVFHAGMPLRDDPLQCTDFPSSSGDYKSRCEFGNSLGDGYHYKYNLNRGTKMAVCGQDSGCWCCRCKEPGDCAPTPRSYRIPAIVRSSSGVLLAFAEGRHGPAGADEDVRELALRRSSDNGKSWEPARFPIGNVWARAGNPWPIALADGRVAVLYRDLSKQRTLVVFSEDNGDSWSAPTVVEDAGAPGGSPGPGNGVRLSNGRLIVASHYGAYGYDRVHFSDDNGATWHRASANLPGMDEATITEVGEGELLLVMRHKDEASRGKAVARSSDFGSTWSGLSYDAELKGPVCEGALSTIAGTVYFSNPDSTSGRDHLTLKSSQDGGRSWSQSLIIQRGGSGGYSSIVRSATGSATFTHGTGGILYEGSGGDIVFREFPLTLDWSDDAPSAALQV